MVLQTIYTTPVVIMLHEWAQLLCKQVDCRPSEIVLSAKQFFEAIVWLQNHHVNLCYYNFMVFLCRLLIAVVVVLSFVLVLYRRKKVIWIKYLRVSKSWQVFPFRVDNAFKQYCLHDFIRMKGIIMLYIFWVNSLSFTKNRNTK